MRKLHLPFYTRWLSIVENSFLIFVTLFILMISFVGYVYVTHLKAIRLSEKIHRSYNLSASLFMLSQTKYHAQLELYEHYTAPSSERRDAFIHYRDEFFERINKMKASFEQNEGLLPDGATDNLNQILAELPLVQKSWQTVLDAIDRDLPLDEKRKVIEQEETRFDSFSLNPLITKTLDDQIKLVDDLQQQAEEANSNHNVMVVLGAVFALFLSAIVLLLHRAAIQGKSDQLKLVQTSKLASLGEMSAGLAHEINNPLMFIKGFNDHIRTTLQRSGYPTDSIVWDDIKEVDAGVERIGKIVRHFKTFARPAAEAVSEVNINDVIRRAFSLFHEQLRFRNIDVELDLTAANPLILAEELRIEQVFLNLISNARDALVKSAKSQPRISVRTVLQDGHVVIRFADNGTGMTRETLSRIFDPFFTTKPIGSGTGLGLSISHGIVRDYNGHIDATSIQDEMTVFMIRFPVSASAAAELNG